MPTFNKVDMLDCANGHHDIADDGECRVCGHIDEAHSLEADVWALAYESAARAAGWQQDACGIFHPNRDGNNTGDDAEYVGSWEEACDISGFGAEGR